MRALGPITREEAIALDAIYVKFREEHGDGHWDDFKHVQELQNSLKKGQLVLTVDPHSLSTDRKHPTYMLCRVSMVKRNCYQAIDGPVVRVGDGQFTWRVDGDGYCVPVSERQS